MRLHTKQIPGRAHGAQFLYIAQTRRDRVAMAVEQPFRGSTALQLCIPRLRLLHPERMQLATSLGKADVRECPRPQATQADQHSSSSSCSSSSRKQKEQQQQQQLPPHMPMRERTQPQAPQPQPQHISDYKRAWVRHHKLAGVLLHAHHGDVVGLQQRGGHHQLLQQAGRRAGKGMSARGYECAGGRAGGRQAGR
jgi:hypothetical protein